MLKNSMSIEGLLLSCFSRVQLFGTLWTVACQASVSEGFSKQEYRSVLANTGCHTLLYFLLPYPSTPLSNWHCQNPYDPNSCTTSTPGPHRGKPKPSRAAQEQPPVDDPRAEVEMKPQLKPRGSVAKEEDPKPSHQL